MPAFQRQIDHFRATGAQAAAAHAAVHAAFRAGVKGKDPARYSALLDAFRAATAAAYPFDADKLRQRIDAGQKAALDTAIAFLVADPWFFRSGYYKASLIGSVKRAPLDANQRSALQHVVMHVIKARDRQEFRIYCRLAAAIGTPAFMDAVDSMTKDPDPAVRRRAVWVLAALKQASLSRH